MKIYKFLIFIISAIYLTTCQDNPVSPPPGNRNYNWTIDTLEGLYTPRYRLWGSSTSNLWAVTRSDPQIEISFYNGEIWRSYSINGMNVPVSVYGFSDNEVFIGTIGGDIWKYNGSSWILFAELTKDGRKDIVFDNIWGQSPNDFYAVGAFMDSIGPPNHGVIAHYSNDSWTMLNTDAIKGLVEHLYINYPDNRKYLQVIKMGNGEYPDSTLIYEYTQERFIRLYGSVWAKGQQADLSIIGNKVYFILGNQIATRENNQFHQILSVDNPNFYQRIWGRSKTDIFLLMTDGLAHYNGSNIEYLFNFTLPDIKPWTQIYGSALFDKEVFFLASEPTSGLSLIYHGTLIE